MPPILPVRSLRDLSLLYIAQNESIYCCPNQCSCAGLPDHSSSCSLPCMPTCSFHGLFEELLTESLKDGLFDILIETEKLKFCHIPLFIYTNLTDLNLSGYQPLLSNNPGQSSLIFIMIMAKCKKLMRLDAHQWNTVPENVICELPTKLTHLTKLIASQTLFNDQACEAIGQHCHELVELGIDSCLNVTDQGMMNLCLSAPNDPKKCTKLRKLDVYGTKVTVEGVKVVLQNVPGIQCLMHSQIHLAVAGLHKDYEEGQIVPPEHQYQLRGMEINKLEIEEELDNISEKDVRTVIAYCPSIIHMRIVRNETPGIWPILQTVQGLEYLYVCDHTDTNFSLSITPIIQASGETLQHLNIEYMEDINLAAIGALCPALKTLKLLLSCESESYPNTCPHVIRAGKDRRFKQLTEIFIQSVHCVDCDHIEIDLSEVLMYSIKLERALFQNVHEFDDALLNRVLRVNRLKHLEKLGVFGCNRISGAAVSQLLLMDNKLRRLNLLDCQNISQDDMDNMIAMAEHGNMDIQICTFES